MEEELPFAVTFEPPKRIDPGSRDITVNKLGVTVNGKQIFVDTNVTLSCGCRYGLMGPNGQGKSTLLRLLAARQIPVPQDLYLLLVEQEQEFTGSELTAVDAVLQSHKTMKRYSEEATVLRARTDLSEEELQRLLWLETELDAMGVASADANVRRILCGLGFPTSWHERPTKSFSGGWRKRIALAAAVFNEPDVLLLDEPTNHLDLNAVIWLEAYLCERYSVDQKKKKTLVVVSHDTDFLNEVCTHMIHIDAMKLHFYKGGIDAFANQVEQTHREHDRRHHTVMRQIAEKKRNGMSRKDVAEWIKTQVAAGKLNEDALVRRRDYIVNFPFQPPTALRGGSIVKLEDVAFAYPNGPLLFSNVNMSLWDDSRITLCGPNGVGKSTLLNLMTGVLEPTEGIVTINRQLRIGRYNQHFVERLPMELSPTEYMQRLGLLDPAVARRQLGCFGLEGVVHHNPIATLSGGQKARVAFAAISAEKPHFLLFDEPTNHLDLESIDALCDAINTFEGGVLVVTHDARLIAETGMSLWVMSNGTVGPFDGDVEAYKTHVRALHQKEEEAMLRERAAKTASARAAEAIVAAEKAAAPPPKKALGMAGLRKKAAK